MSSAAAYPNFIGYLTDYIGERGRYSVLVDSSFDWGQGLLALRDYMDPRSRIELWDVIRDALPRFTPQDCANYFTAAGYEPD